MISDRTATLLALLCAVVFPNIKAFSSNGKYLGWNGPYFSMSSEKDKSPSTITCPDRRKTCRDRQTCCFRPTIQRYACCSGKGPRARCCSSGMTCCFQHQICCPQDAGCCNAGHWCDLTTMQCVPFLQLRDRGYVSIPISKPGLVQLNPQEETLVEKIHSTTGQSQQTSPKEHTGLTGEY